MIKEIPFLSWPKLADDRYHALTKAFLADNRAMAESDFPTFVRSKPKALKKMIEPYRKPNNINIDEVARLIIVDILTLHEYYQE